MNRTGSKILHGMLLATSAMVASPVIVSTAAMANPAGGSVAVGSATITNPSATQTVINQSSKRALINWNSFSVQPGASVTFNQPNSKSLTVNRVTGPGSSTIDGSLFANGNIWLLNANGILFGKGSQINVGSILATTSELSDADFAAGNNNFTASPNSNASVINQGTITASRGGSVVLSAPTVSNEGMIQADLGTVVLGGAQAFTVDMTGDNLLRYEISAPVTQTPTDAQGKPGLALVSNSGTISAAGGHVVMTARAAQNVEDNVINNTGMVEATTVSVHNGEVDIDAGPDGTADVGGTVDASGSGNGQTGGTVTVTGGTVNVASGANINVSGNAGGGTVMIGGGPHGTGTLAHAQRTVIGAGSTINADATGKGDGGNVTVWSDGTTQFNGAISSRGGALGGNGGQVETSGHNLGVGTSATVNTTAPLGLTGDWLLDPSEIDIVSSSGVSLPANGTLSAGEDSGQTENIKNSTIVSSLDSTDVTLEATSLIDVEADVNYTSSHAFNLLSEGNLDIDANIQNAGTGDITLIAGWDGTTPVSNVRSGGFGASGAVVIGGGAASDISVGSASGSTFVGGNYVQVEAGNGNVQLGYDGAGGGAITVQAIDLLELTNNSDVTTRIGNGDAVGSQAGTGDIVISANETTIYADNNGITIGNAMQGSGATGNLTFTTGTLSDANGVLNSSITGDLSGGDVSITYTNQTSTDLGFLNYNSAHNLTIGSTGDLDLTDAITNCGTGSISLFAGGTETNTAGNLTIAGAVTTGGSSGINNFFEAGDSITISNAVDAGAGKILMHAGEETGDGNPGAILDPLGNLLTADSIRLVNDKGGTSDQTIGTSSAPIYVTTNHLAAATAEDDIYISSASGGFDVGDGFFGIYGHNITLTANGSITQNSGEGIDALGVLNVSTTNGSIALNANGTGGNQIMGAILLNSTGDASLTNTIDTVIGVHENPDDVPQNFVVGGNLTITVTNDNADNNIDGHDSTLTLAGRIHVAGSGDTTLQAVGDVDNDDNGDGTIYANNLNLISSNGSIGAGTWSFGLGAAGSDPLNLYISAPNGSATINPGALNIGTDEGGADVGGLLWILGNGAVTQSKPISAGSLSVNLGPNEDVTLDNANNTVSGEVSFFTTGNISFANSEDTTLGAINGGNVTTSAGNVTITVTCGTLSQSEGAPSAIRAATLTVSAASGEGVTLNNISNDVTGAFSAITPGFDGPNGNVSFTNNGTITVGEIHGTPQYVPACGSVAAHYQTGPAGNITLTAESGGISITGGILAANESTITLTAPGNITQVHNSGLDGWNLVVSGANVTLIDPDGGTGNELSGTVNITATGDVVFGNNAETTLGTTSVGGNFTALSEGDLTVTSSIVSNGTGNITLVGGWDGSTPPSCITTNATSAYGNAGPDSNGDVLIGANADTANITVGSAQGTTSVYGSNVTISGAEGFIGQLGYAPGGNGTINVYAAHDISVTSSADGQPGYAVIGNGNPQASGAVGGAITLHAGENISVTSGEGQFATIGNFGQGASVGGDINVTAVNGNVSLFATPGVYNEGNSGTSFPAAIGNENLSDTGSVGGNVTVSAGQDVLVTGEGHLAQIGNSGSAQVSGNINVTAAGNVTLYQGEEGGVALIGNHGIYNGSDGTIIDVSGNVSVIANGTTGVKLITAGEGYAQIGNVGEGGQVGGAVTVTANNGSITLTDGEAYNPSGHGEAEIGNFGYSTVSGDVIATANGGNVTLDAAVSGDFLQIGNSGGYDANGSIGSNVTVTASDNVSLTAGEYGAIAQIGNGARDSQASISGDINVTATNGTISLYAQNGDNDFAIIGNGNADGSATGTVGGNITLAAGEGILMYGEGGFARIGNAGQTQVSGNINVTAAGNITLQNFEGGVALIGNYGVAGLDGSPVVSGDISVTANGTGGIELNTGGEGFGHVTIGNVGEGVAAQTSGNITVTANAGGISLTTGYFSQANAQIGNYGSGSASGDITVAAKGGDINITATQGESVLQIGNAGYDANGSVSGNVTVSTSGDLNLEANSPHVTAQIGNGLSYDDGAVSGDVSVTANGSITVDAYGGSNSHALIGNGDSNATGAVSGNVTLDADADVVLTSSEGATAQIGNLGNGSSVNGTIAITAGRNFTLSIVGDPEESDNERYGSLIGNYNACATGTVDGNISVNVTQAASLFGEGGHVGIGNTGEGTSVSGTINVTAGGNLVLSSVEGGRAWIGNRGSDDNMTVGGDISVTANGSGGIGLWTNGTSYAETHIGNVVQGDGAQVFGNITVTAANGGVIVSAFGPGSSTLIGNLGYGDIDPDIGGNINVAADDGDLTVQALGLETTAQIGNSGYAGGGTMGGNISVSTSGDLNLISQNTRSVAQIGNGAYENQGPVSGNINITAAGNVSASATGEGGNALIGNGDASGNSEGSVSGDIALTAGGVLEFDSETGGTAWLGNIGGNDDGDIESGNVTVTMASENDQDDAYFGDMIAADLGQTSQAGSGGKVFVGVTGNAGHIGGFGLNSPNTLTIADANDLNITSSIQNSGSGAVNLVAGWDGTTYTPSSLGNSGVYGNNNGSVNISGNGGAIVGSQKGSTTVEGANITLLGTNGASQIGYDGSGSGNVTVLASKNILMEAGNCSDCYVQIGDGTVRSNLTESGNVTVHAGGDINLEAGDQAFAYAQIGNGGDSSHGTFGGNINVTAGGGLSLLGSEDYAQIGNAGWGTSGNASGNINVNVAGNLTVEGGGNNVGNTAYGYAQIGHGGQSANGNYTGNITVAAAGSILLASAANGLDAQIGDGGQYASGNFTSNISVTAGGALSMVAGTHAQYVQIGNGGGASGTNNSAGNITVNAGALALTGSISPAADNQVDIGNSAVNGTASGNIAVGVNGTATITTAEGGGNVWIGNYVLNQNGSASGAVSILAGNIDSDEDNNGDTGQFISSDLQDGALTLGLTNASAQENFGNFTYSSPYDLTLLVAGSMDLLGDIQNSGSGNITIVTGWNPAVAPANVASTAGAYGNGGAMLAIGGPDGADFVSLGSAGGTTNVLTGNLVVDAYDGRAQLGYRGDGTGAINVNATGDVTVQTDSGNIAQIGNGGLFANGTVGGDISVDASTVEVIGNANDSIAEIGNIGGGGSTLSGNITVNAFGVSAITAGTDSTAQIGNSADATSDPGVYGNTSGDIQINAHFVDLVTYAGDSGAVIGNGSQLGYNSDTTGTVNVSAAEVTLASTGVDSETGDGESEARIGNRGRNSAGGDVTVATTDSLVLEGDNAGNSVIGDHSQGSTSGNVTVSSGGTIAAQSDGADSQTFIGHSGTNANGDVSVTANGDITLNSVATDGLVGIGNAGTGTFAGNVTVASLHGNVTAYASGEDSFVGIGLITEADGAGATGNVTVSGTNVALIASGGESLANIGMLSEGGSTTGNVAVTASQNLTLFTAEGALADIGPLAFGGAADGTVDLTANAIATAGTAQVSGDTANIVVTGAGQSAGSANSPLLLAVNTLSVETNNGDAYLSSPAQGLSIGAAGTGIDLGTGNLTLSTDGNLTQTAAIDAASVNVSTSNGSIALTNAANNFTTASLASTGDAALTDSTGLTVSDANVTGNLTLSARSISQTGAIAASVLTASASNGGVLLTNTGNAIGTASISSSADSALTDSTALTIAGATVGSNLTLNAASISQTGAINATNLGVSASNGSIALTNSGNTITNALVNASGDAALTDSGNLTVTGASVGGNLTLAATSIGQSGAIHAHGLTVAASNGGVVLTNTGNAITNASLTSTGDASLTDSTGVTITGGTVGGNLTLAATSIAQSGAVTANTLTATASNGSIALTNAGNAITSVSLTSSGDTSLSDAGNLTVTGATAGGNLTLAAASIGQTGAIHANKLTATASNGGIALTNTGNNVTAASLTSTGDASLYDVASLTETGAAVGGNLTLLTKGNLTFASSAQLTNGSLLAVAGWDGTTTSPSALTSGSAYGNNGSDIIVGGSGASGGVSVGSQSGSTTLASDDLLLSAINGYAQVGYHGGGSGAITVNATGNVTLNGGAGTAYFAQIGDGGYKVSGSNSGAVSVLANGNVALNAGSGQEAYAQIGNGGAESNSSSTGYTNTGTTTVHGKAVALKAGTGNASYAQIGDGGYKSGQSLNGVAKLGGDVVIAAVSGVTLNGSAADAYAQIGNGGDLVNSGSANGSSGTTSGNVTVGVSAPTTPGNAIVGIAGSGANSYVQIGNGGNGENSTATGNTVTFNISGNVTINDLVLTGSNTGANGYAQVGNGDGAHSGTGNVSGNIAISQGTIFNLTPGTAPGTSSGIQNATGTGTASGTVSGYTAQSTTPTSNPTTAGSVSTIIQNNNSPTSFTYTASAAPSFAGQTSDFSAGGSSVSSAPTPLEKLAGEAEDEDVPSDGVADSVGGSLNGGGKSHVVSKTIIPGVLDEIITLTPTHPHGVPPADVDYSSWGNEALWRW